MLCATSQVNTAYLAIPIFILMFNDPTPVIPILFFQVIILTTILLSLIEVDRNNINTVSFSIYRKIKRFLYIPLKNPIIIASCIGVLFSYYAISIPIPVLSTLKLLGQTAAPLALFALGQSMYQDLRCLDKEDIFEIITLVGY